MKKLIRSLVVLMTAAVLFASCGVGGDKQGTYAYHCVYYGNLSSSERADQLTTYLDGVCGGYFARENTYSGLQSETMTAACEAFSTNVAAIDEDLVISYLQPGEHLIIYLVASDSGMQLMYCIWQHPEDPYAEEAG